MMRYVDEIGLFLLPFVLFFLFLVATRQEALAPGNWRGPRGWLAVAGVLLAIAGILVETLGGGASGTYRPAHLENGQLVPGKLE